MKRRWFKSLRRWALRLGVLAAVLYGTLVYLTLTTPVRTVENAAPAEAALIFGAIVSGGQISPLHAERLQAGKALLDRGVVKTLVVSNAERAAERMRDYLIAAGVPPGAIELDGQALKTPDTCANERAGGRDRAVVLVSQRYHLPRIALQCSAFGIDGQFVAADGSRRRNGHVSGWTKLRIRAYRHTREALWVWATLLGVYPD